VVILFNSSGPLVVLETWTRGPTLLLGFAPRPACNHRLIVIFIFYFEPKTAREAPTVDYCYFY